MKCVDLFVAAVFGLVVLHVFPPSVKADELVTVNALSAPWLWVNGGLNTNFQDANIGNQPPTVVAANLSAGFPLTPGDAITLTYVSGLWCGCDANGDSRNVFNSAADAHGTLHTWELFPAYFFAPTEFPAHGGELDGVFTDASGSIIGTPHRIGNQRTLIVPSGATQLQLGFDDNEYGDNSGSVIVNVSEIPKQGKSVPVFPTGQDSLGNRLAGGVADPHYFTLQGSSQAVVLSDANCFNGGSGIGWPEPTTGGKWINYADTWNTNGPHTFRTTFDLTGLDPATASLDLVWTGDNDTEIVLNGIDTGIGIGNLGYQTLHGNTIASGFVSGINTLDFYVSDMDTWDGLLVSEISVTATPEPSTITLLLAGIASLLAFARWRRD
jgi:hypothetical protein